MESWSWFEARILWLEERRSLLKTLLNDAALGWTHAPAEWRKLVVPLLAEEYPPAETSTPPVLKLESDTELTGGWTLRDGALVSDETGQVVDLNGYRVTVLGTFTMEREHIGPADRRGS